MSKVRRFIYVVPPTGNRLLHRIYKSRYNPVEGDKTGCSAVITTKWRKAGFTDKITRRRCSKCEKADVR